MIPEGVHLGVTKGIPEFWTIAHIDASREGVQLRRDRGGIAYTEW